MQRGYGLLRYNKDRGAEVNSNILIALTTQLKHQRAEARETISRDPTAEPRDTLATGTGACSDNFSDYGIGRSSALAWDLKTDPVFHTFFIPTKIKAPKISSKCLI